MTSGTSLWGIIAPGGEHPVCSRIFKIAKGGAPGDPLYRLFGQPLENLPGLPGDGGYFLHARFLKLHHPITGEQINLEAALPSGFSFASVGSICPLFIDAAIGGELKRSVRIWSMAIDDPLAATASQYPDQQKNKVGELTLELAGVAFWPLKVFNILRSRILGDYGLERVKALLNALQGEFHRNQQTVEKTQCNIEALREKINSPEFADSLILAADEAQRTQSEQKIERLGAVLSNALLSGDDETVAGDDLVGYIRDLSSLTGGDVQALQFLGNVFKDSIRQRPEMDDPNDFTMMMGSYLRGIEAMSVHHDDFYSRCSRLTGFGLATEVERSPTRMALKDHCFRPTRRGLRLINLLATKTG